MTKKHVLSICFVIIALSGCSNPKSSAEYKRLEIQTNQLDQEIQNLQSKVDSIDELKADLEQVRSERLRLIDEFVAAIDSPQVRQAAIRKIIEPACKAWAYSENDVKAKLDDSNSAATFDARYAQVGKRVEFWSALMTNASSDYSTKPAFAALSEEARFSKCYEKYWSQWFDDNCETVDRMALKRNPESFIGKCLKGTVRVAQADSNTGPCAFQGYISGDYDVRAQFGISLMPTLHSLNKNCSEKFGKIVEGRTITFWGFGLGSYSYETTSNGNMTVPAFKILAFTG